MIVNKNILGLLEYLHGTTEAITMIPRIDGMIVIDLNIYSSVKLVFEEWYGRMEPDKEGRQTEFGIA